MMDSMLVVLIAAMGPDPVVANSMEQAKALGYPTGISVEMEAAIVPAIERYTRCVSRNMRRVYVSPSDVTRDTEQGIAKCSTERSSAIAEADVALAGQPGWSSKAKRDAEINAAFDSTDASSRKLARETEAFMRKPRRR
jgi:hypothetical protein